MAEGRQREAWQRTASLMALIAEAHRNPKKRASPFRPDEFDPFEIARRRATKRAEDWELVRAHLKRKKH